MEKNELMDLNAQLAEEEDEQSADTDNPSEKYLTFFVNEQLYTIPSSQVIEIISMQLITYMPSVPDFVKGVINIRGKVVPLIDLQLRLKKTETTYNEKTCIIIVELGEISVGLIVDLVHDVTDIYESQISPPPKVANKDKECDFLSGIAKLGNEVAMILDISKTLDDLKDSKKKPKAPIAV